MLISLVELVEKYNIVFKGILHIGAHEAEELDTYEKYLSRNQILWIEALIDKVVYCKNKYKDILIENAVVSDNREIVIFNRSNNGQSSSILELGLHKEFHPHVHFVEKFYVQSSVLRNILPIYNNINFNFINLDIQGAELKALKGMEEYLHNIDYIYTEVNSDYVYEGCCLIGELDDFLNKYGFLRVETVWCGDCKWGDAFYIKQTNNV